MAKETKNNPTIICFDVDLTLITEKGLPLYDNIILLISLSRLKNTEIHLWSGGGSSYAQHWGERLGIWTLVKRSWDKTRVSADILKPDLTFDDQEIELGKVNIRV